MSVELLKAAHQRREARKVETTGTEELLADLRRQFSALPRHATGGTPRGVPDQICLAAASFAEPVTQEALLVRAWQAWPQTFGLKHFEDKFPDSNKLKVYLYGAKGLIKTGRLARLGDRLTARRNGEPPAAGARHHDNHCRDHHSSLAH